MADDLLTRLHAAITARREVALAAGTPPPCPAAEWAVEAMGVDDVARVIDGDGSWVATDLVGEELAVHIALHDPADAIRRYDRDLRVLERHKPWTYGVFDDSEPAMWWCTGCSGFGPLFRAEDCDEILDLATAYPEASS